MDDTSPHPHGLSEEEGITPMGFSSPDAPAKQKSASIHAENIMPDRGHPFNDASTDVLSSDGTFLDAQSSVSNMDAGFVPIRVRISDDADDEDYEVSIGSSENFDSASERMTDLSNTSLASPSGSFKEFFALSEAPSITVNSALRQLNELNSGISSLDTSLLENTREEEFRFRVMEIAVSNYLSLDDEVIHDIMNALLPVVRENFKQSNAAREATWDAGDFTREMPVAKPTADDDDDTDRVDDSEETSELDQSENGEFLPHYARGLRVHVADDESEDEHEVSNCLPSLEIPMSSEVAKHEVATVEVGNGSAPFDEVEYQNNNEYEDDKNHKQPDLMRHDAQIAESQQKESDGFDRATKLGHSPSCTEADVNEDGSLHVRHDEQNAHESKKVTKTEDASVSNFFDAGANVESGVCMQQLEDTKQEASRSMDAASLQQMRESISCVGHAFDSSSLSIQQETLTDISQKLQERSEGEVGEAVHNRGLEVKNPERGRKPLYGTDHGAAKNISDTVVVYEKDTMEVYPEEHILNGSKSSGVTDAEADKVDDKEEEEDSTAKKDLVLLSSIAPATGMPSVEKAGPSLAAQPAGVGRSVPSLEHGPHAVPHSNGASVPSSSMASKSKDSGNDLTEGMDDAWKKLQAIRVKFLRLAHKLGQSAHNVLVAQVLYRLELAEQLRGDRRARDFSLERMRLLAEEQEVAGQGDLDFECTIMVLGKSGVGKSATINSLFGETKSGTDAYKPATKKVKEIIGTVNGIKLRVIDTPGLLTSFSDQQYNRRIMSSVKHHIKRSPPDIVLYFDRLDMQCRDYGDLPLLQTISDVLGGAIWYNAMVVLTHGSSAPPDGTNGAPIGYEMFVAQRSHVVQQSIRQAAGDMRLMTPVSLVENHAACQVNRAGHSVLPNGQVWKPQLLLICLSSKILAEANSFMKLQDSSPAKSLRVRPRVPPLPFLLSSTLQSRSQLKLPNEQSDDEEISDSDQEVESEGEEEYDDLPPFRRLTRDELTLLDKEQRRLYHEELDYREKLFMKKQMKDEHARKKELKRRLASLPKELSDLEEQHLEEAAPDAVPVTMPDMALPPSFDSDNPTHRYRFLDTANQWLARPVLDSHGWDHDSGFDGLNVEKVFVISKKVPVSISGQITKDKKETSLKMECAASFKNGDGKITQAGLDIQTLGKDISYTLRSETKFSNFKRNKTICGLAVTMLGDTVAAGLKLEDRLVVGKRFKLVMNGGALTGQGDVAYGGNLEASLRDKDYPIDHTLSTFGLSIMNWHGDVAIGGNLQLQLLVDQTMISGRANLNNRKTGQISIRASSSNQLQMALIGLIPLLRAVINNRVFSSSQSMQ